MTRSDSSDRSAPDSNQKINLENLKKQAKALLKSVRENNSDALHRVGPYFGDPRSITLQSAQLVLAREHGFSSWTKLKQFAEQGELSGELAIDQLASEFLDLVVVQYSNVADQGPVRFRQAQGLLDENPQIRSASIYTAAAIGDADKVSKWLDDYPQLLNQRGGIFNWEPLMYACYARLPGASSLQAALALLDRGADPNAHYMWGGQYKFTALTGAFGQGEAGPVKQPEHPDYQQLCRALLAHGANANDSQAAYNRCFEADNTWLSMLIEFGLNAKEKNNWLLCENDKLVPNPNETMHFHLIQAIHRGYPDRARMLIDHGVDVDRPDDTYDTRTKGKTPYEAAMLLGQLEIADYLLQHGASKIDLPPLSQFQSACSLADKAGAEELLRQTPGLAKQIKPIQGELLNSAISSRNKDALQMMIELNFELNDNSKRLPLAEAAWHGRLDMVKLLIEHGADPTLRDPHYFTPATGFAQYNNQEHIVAYLDTLDMDIFTAASRGILTQLDTLLSDQPELLEVRFAQIRPSPMRACENDWMTPLVYASVSNQLLAVKYLLDKGADPTVNNKNGVSLLTLVKNNLCKAEIIETLQEAQKTHTIKREN